MTACRNTSATPVNVQWWSYPGMGSYLDAKVVATCPSNAGNSSNGNMTTSGNSTTGSNAVFTKISVLMIAAIGAFFY